MAEDGRISRFLSALGKPFRRKTTPQPQMPLWTTGIQEPVLVQGITIPALYAVTNENLILRTVVTTLQQEIFRRGYYWEKKFDKKCMDCDEEYQHDVESCELCGGEVRNPDKEQLTYPKWLLTQRNSCEQTFLDVLREVEYDLNITDDAFLVLVKEYYLDPETNEITFYRVKEILRGDPIFMRIVSDKRGVRGGRFKTCLMRREGHSYTYESENDPVTGLPLHDVHYVNTAGSGKTQYFVEGEVIHVSKFYPSKLYGRSAVATLWRQAMALTAMDNYIYTAYQKRRSPKGIVSVTTDNLESMKSFWKAVDEKMERDPHYIPKIGIESQSGRGGVNWVKFMDTLEEMQYIAVRDEIRNRIAAFYGVSSVFMMDSGKSGGLSNEGMQILVTNRAVEFGHKVYTENLFPQLLNQMNVTDWNIKLHPSEVEDEVTRLRRDEMEVNIAQRMTMLGFKPQLLEETTERDIRFIYTQIPPEEAMQQGGKPPMGGGMMPGMGMGGGMMQPGMGGMPPGMQGTMPPPIPGGQGMGMRNRGPAAVDARGTAGTGAPFSSVQQRGMQQQPMQQANNNLQRSRYPGGA